MAGMDHLERIADELGYLRQRIRALKAREEALREAILAVGPDGPIDGQVYRAIVTRQRRRCFVRDALPPHVLQMPTLWHERTTDVVVCSLLDSVVRTFDGGEAPGARGPGAGPARPASRGAPAYPDRSLHGQKRK